MKWADNFLLGAATAAHQVEGNNIYSDYWVIEHLEHSDFVEPSGEAADHYNRYEQDIALLAGAGLNAYRFSIEWARIEPQEGQFDVEAVEHYRQVLACCKKYHITPVVTLHHFSSPAWLIKKGGWAQNFVVDAFARYTEYVAQQLGDDIPYFCTINEANMGGQLNKIAAAMMNTGARKEGSVQVGTNTEMNMQVLMQSIMEQSKAFDCNPGEVNTFLKPRTSQQEKVVMKAHQAAKKAIKSVCPAAKVGLTLSLFDYQAESGGEAKADKLWQEDFGFYLPYFQDDDFLGVQNYTRKIVDSNGEREPAKEAPVTQMEYEDYPQAIGHVLSKVAEDYKGELIVTENGISTEDDMRRCEFIREALSGVEKCVDEGLPLKGYFYWSLLDNFEWQMGYSKTFGLIAVDRTNQIRQSKKSLYVLGACLKKDDTE
ncbi:hypothetical protein C808_02584 [Lachnospiraceae bacterium M18-1]|nr:hypothetical protein C808_02584 [Lachnospiraceae bacterium M18-1]